MRVHIITILLAAFFPLLVNGQNITVSKTKGCVPLAQVQFDFPTAGDWDFGDGGGIIAIGKASVQHSYVVPGTYDAIFYQNGVEVDRETIEVYSKPSTAFNLTGDANGCVPLSTSFADASVGGGGVAITGWKWDFGDGVGSTKKDPNHIFTLVGNFDVSLIVTDANGCDSSIVKKKLISVTNAPTASFTTSPNPASACVGPLTVSFTNNSVNSTGGLTDLTYKWDFGNGQTSTDVSPAAMTYTSEGTFVVSLEVVESGGCTVTTSRVVNIGNPVAIPDLPDTVCLNKFINGLGNKSVGASSYIWKFNGGPTYNSKNPNHTFNVAGDQQITLTANSSQGCSDDTVFTVHVEDPSVDFARNPTYRCNEPYCFDFDGQSPQTNIASWTWGFGDGKGVVARSEDTTYCYSINDTLYYVHDPYYFTASVQIVTTNGCRANQSYVDTIYPVSAFFVPDSSMGCAPVTVTFSDSTRSRENIVSWEYNFGDGTTSSAQNPAHTYTTAGEYEVVLIAENSLGCKDTSFPVTIQVGEPVALNFTVSPSTVCVGESVTFTDVSGNTDIDYWHYSTNSNKSTDCIGSGTQKWAKFDEVGVQDVTFQANYNGCISSTTQNNAVTVEGPLSSLRYTGTCVSPLDYTFIGTIQGATSWDWDFGDGTAVVVGSSDSTVNHSYAATGDYIVSLITHNNTNSCAADTQKIEVNVRQITAVITGDSSICNGVSYNYTGASSTDVFNSCADAYRWDLGDKTVPRTRENPDISFTFPTTGNHSIRLITHDVNGCKDTTTKSVTVSAVVARIGADTLTGCLPLTIALSDSSISDTAIVQWLWSSATIPNAYKDTIAETKNTSYSFNIRSDQKIRLIVRDSLGCKDTTEVVVVPLNPDTTFSAITDRTICVGDSVKFNPTNANSLSSTNWTFGTSGTSTETSPYFVFNQPGIHDVALTVTDTNNCSGISRRPAYVSVDAYPIAGFDIRPEEDTLGIICYEERISFKDTSGGGTAVSWLWDLQTGQSVVNAPEVIANFENKGIYNVSLEVTTANGCKDNVSSQVELIGPEADFDMSKNIVCAGDSVLFTIKDSTDVSFYLWDFGDGEGLNEQSPASHTYLNIPTSLKTNVILLLWGKDSICPQKVIKPLDFEKVLADFTLPEDTVCMNDPFVVVNSSVGADFYSWTVKNSSGAVQSSSVSDPIISNFSTVGIHEVELIIQNNGIGCVDTLVKEFLINPIPSIAARDTGYCEGDVVTLQSSGYSGLTYSWSPASLVDEPSKATSIATPTESTDFTILVTDSNKCTNTDVANIFIQRSFDPETVDTCVVIGEIVPLGVDKGTGYTYKWEGSESDLAWLECRDCATQNIAIIEEVGEVNYTLIYTDSIGCFDNEVTYKICILPSYTFDVPTAFTPDGDGVNDIVYLRGHGISEVLMFKIFNRWGELVFESNELSKGWDGIYKGVAQNMETYIYKAEVKFYNGKTEAKGGSLNLIR